MGMYTELFVEGGLRADAPEQVKEVIKRLFNRNYHTDDPLTLPDHPFFSKSRWNAIGNCCSFYHVPLSMSACEETQGQLYFVSRSDLKNYEGEIEAFLNWLRPYCEDLRGWHMYEEDEAPTVFIHRSFD